MHEGSRVVPWGRMDDHPRRLVDDGDVIVFVKDVQRDGLRDRLDHEGVRYLQVDDISRDHAVRRVGGMTVDVYQVALDQSCGCGAAQVGRLLGEEAVQPRRPGGRRYAEGLRKK